MTDDFFCNHLDPMIVLRFPLAVLANRIPWQYFSGKEYFEHRWPCDPTQLVKFRKLIVEEGVEEMLARSVKLAVTLKLIAKKELRRIIVDLTVQEKAITHPADRKLLKIARVKLVEIAKSEGITLKQQDA